MAHDNFDNNGNDLLKSFNDAFEPISEPLSWDDMDDIQRERDANARVRIQVLAKNILDELGSECNRSERVNSLSINFHRHGLTVRYRKSGIKSL